MNSNTLLDKIYKISAENNHNLTDIWLTQILFSWRWWVEALLATVPWIVWIVIRDKKNTGRLLFTGMVIAIISNALDIVGATRNIWHYDWNLIPSIAIYLPWDFTLFPVSVMLMLQFKPKINPFIKAIVFSFLCAFAFEPLFSYLGMYHSIAWKYWYSFIIYIPIYLFCNFIYKSRLWKGQSDL